MLIYKKTALRAGLSQPREQSFLSDGLVKTQLHRIRILADHLNKIVRRGG